MDLLLSMKRIIRLLVLIILPVTSVFSQCVTSVDFNTWSEAGWPANGNWIVQGGGASVRQTTNGSPAFFLSPFELINVSITGNFRSTDDDDDWMGFVFSHLSPVGTTLGLDSYNSWLFDWKQDNQGAAPQGKSLCRLNGTIPPANYAATFNNHTNSPPDFTVVQNDFGGPGWIRNFNHAFRLDLTFTRATIFIDGAMVFDQQDCFFPGYFGFYNYSQQDCYYSNFQYSLFIDFVVLTPQVCPGDQADFQFLDPCFGFNFNFNQYQSLSWDYGDGTVEVNNNPTVNNVNPSHVYTTPGTYTVTLDILDTQGCTATATQQITVLAPPDISFAASPTCDGNAMNFTDNSSNNPTLWTWDFGDGSLNDNNQNPSHTYPAAGTYTVELTAVAQNCSATETMDVTVNPNPVADFDVQNSCAAANTDFTDQSTVATGNIIQWDWDFGDGNTSNQQNPSHTYLADGNYNVSLTVTTDQNCTDTYINAVSVYPLPVVDFTFTDDCMDDAIVFTDQSTVSSGNIAQWAWDFGDGSAPDLNQNTSHTYTTPGIKDVTLSVVTDNGCTGTTTHQVNVFPEPVADFSFTDECKGVSTTFQDLSTLSSGTIDLWDWDLDDGTTETQQNFSYLYANAGVYNVSLTVTTDNGCIDLITQPVEVFDLPVAAFSFQDVCQNTAASFTDNSTIPTGTISDWLWDFGDLQTSILQDPTHNYSPDGTYTVTLTVSSGAGCSSQLQQDIVIFSVPVADFTNTTSCEGYSTDFTDQSSVTNANIVDWDWSFGDGNTSVQQNPSHNYVGFGVYNTTLTVTTDDGCVNTVTQAVTVYASPVPDFTATDVCHNLVTDFTNISTIGQGAITNTDWDFDDTQTSAQNSPQHTYALPDTYNVTLVTTTDNGCTEQVTKPVTVFPLPVVTFISNFTEGCEPLRISFFDQSTILPTDILAQWNWRFGDGNSSTQQNPVAVYTQEGLYDVTVTVTSGNGCSTTLTIADMITVWPKPVAGYSYDPMRVSILEPMITFTDESSGATEWFWDFGDANNSTEQNTIHHYRDTGNYSVEQRVFNDFGCSDTVFHTVIIDPDFIFYIPNSFTPNNDGTNETFTGYGLFFYDFKMRIYNRWGEQVFTSDDYLQPWNGRQDNIGIDQKQDVYVYVITLKTQSGEPKEFRGKVTLYR
jgi:gliding motility-associated-like protein